MDEKEMRKPIAWTRRDRSLKAEALDPKRWHVKENYRINILHPDIYPIYKTFVQIVTGQNTYPPTDAQRLEFERMVLSVIDMDAKTPEQKIAILQWEVDNIHRAGWEPYAWNEKWLKPREREIK